MRVIKYLIYVKSFITLRHKVFDKYVKSTIYWDNPRMRDELGEFHLIDELSQSLKVWACVK